MAVLLAVLGFALVNANTASAQTPVSMTLTPPSDVNPVGTQHTVTASVSCLVVIFPEPCPAGVGVTFQVSGANNRSGFATTNSAGQAFFSYVGTVVGLDVITARAGVAFGQAQKLWIANPPRSITLTPADDTNTVGDLHTVTATVRDQSGNRQPGIIVDFSVGGGGTPAPPGGIDVTDANGEATFTFTNTTVVTNTITASVAGCCFAQAGKRWVAGPAAKLTLSPPAATNPVGTSHTITATVTDAAGQPVPNVVVRFTVMGAHTLTGSCTTNANGQCTFSYTGTVAGMDTITAYADSNNNSMQNLGEPTGGPVTKTWILSPACPPGDDDGDDDGLEDRDERLLFFTLLGDRDSDDDGLRDGDDDSDEDGRDDEDEDDGTGQECPNDSDGDGEDDEDEDDDD